MPQPHHVSPPSGGAAWVTLPTHHAWLSGECDRLLDFAARSEVREGFGWAGRSGRSLPGVPTELWISTRMTYLFALGTLWGRPGAARLVEHGLASLRGVFHDDRYGGWYTSISMGEPHDDSKNAYETAFVVLASSAALTAGMPGAREVLDEALTVLDDHFWSASLQMSADVCTRDFTGCDPYRGANANMHLTEAYLAAADALGDESYRQRALAVATRLVDGHARAHDWRLPEHYDETWSPLPDYHRDQPRHPRQPYGVTPGHLLEWSRLLLSLESGLSEPPGWLLEAAVQLFDRGIGDGWDAEHHGLLYTVDAAGTPVVRERFHWVAAEAIGAAGALCRRLGEPRFEHWYRTLWDWTDRHLVDRVDGGWHHEVDESGAPVAQTWGGKPDSYHPVQATLVGRLPVVSSFARGVAEGHLRA